MFTLEVEDLIEMRFTRETGQFFFLQSIMIYDFVTDRVLSFFKEFYIGNK